MHAMRRVELGYSRSLPLNLNPMHGKKCYTQPHPTHAHGRTVESRERRLTRVGVPRRTQVRTGRERKRKFDSYGPVDSENASPCAKSPRVKRVVVASCS